MLVKPIVNQILVELSLQAAYLNEQQLAQFAAKIMAAKHIFLVGAGRSGIMISAFANRLIHLGFSVSLISEITKPKAEVGDLLIIASGSGETVSLIAYADKAKQLGIDIVLITTSETSTLAALANVKVSLPSQCIQYAQPMGSTFEQLALLVYDSLIIQLVALRQDSFATMKNRHANIE